MAQKALTVKQMREVADAFKAAGGIVTAAADLMGVPRGTYGSRLRTTRRNHPEFFTKFEPKKPATTALSRELAAETMLAIVAAGSVTAAAVTMGLSPSTVAGRLKTIKTTFPDLAAQMPDKEAEKPRTIEDDVQDHRLAVEARSSKARLRDATRQIAALQDELERYSSASRINYEAAEWTRPERTPHKSEHMPCLLTSDFHAGEVARAEETEAGYGYDSDTFVRRYQHMVDTAIYLTTEHVGKDWTFPGFIYERGGDIISGQLHPELVEHDDITPLEAVRLVAEQEMGGIRKLADAFGKVEVKSFGSAGNHDRNLFKPTTKKAWAHSYDLLVEFMLRREFANDARVTFQSSKSFDIRFYIYKMHILLTHGDRIGSRGGQGFVGPAATIMRGVQKVMREQAALGFHLDQIHVGHFHYPMCLPEVISNGSMPGYTEFAKQFRMRPNEPQQALMFYHPKRGMVDYKPIILTAA